MESLPKYYVKLPSKDAHNDHMVGAAGGYAQKLDPLIIQKIHEMVSTGITDTAEVKRGLRMYVTSKLNNELGIEPPPTDRAFYPTNDDVRNHILRAKKALELSKLDQENLHLKIEHWKQKTNGYFYFRPYTKRQNNDSDLNTDVNEITDLEETLLMVHQEKWQQELLVKYGNNITLLDATYKTTKYDIPLFFIAVKTNIGYSIVAEFIVQSESTRRL